MQAPFCKPCAESSTFYLDSTHVYGKNFGPLYFCNGCGARVGARKDGTPLGRLAGDETRELRKKAHAALDPMWKGKMRRDRCSQKEARGAAYRWLSGVMGIPAEQCHIAMLSDEDLKRVVEICSNPSMWKR